MVKVETEEVCHRPVGPLLLSVPLHGMFPSWKYPVREPGEREHVWMSPWSYSAEGFTHTPAGDGLFALSIQRANCQ